MQNLCPHAMHLYVGDIEVMTIPPEKDPLRCVMEPGMKDTKCGIPYEWIGTYGLADEDVARVSGMSAVIVSDIAARALVKQLPQDSETNVFVPDSGPTSVVRNDKGEIIGVRQFLRYR